MHKTIKNKKNGLIEGRIITPVPVHRTKVVKIAWIVHLLVQFYVERNFAKLFVAPKVLNYKVFLISLPKTSSSDAA